MRKLYFKFRRLSSFCYHFFRCIRYILPFTLIFILSVNCFAVQNEFSSLSSLGSLSFSFSTLSRTQVSSGNYDPSTLNYQSFEPSIIIQDGIEFYSFENTLVPPTGGIKKVNCLRIRCDLNEQFQKDVTSSDVFIYNGYFYILGYDGIFNQAVLNANLKNMYLNIYGFHGNYELDSYRIPLSQYFIESSVYDDLDDHYHSFFKVAIDYSFESSFTFTGFSFDFNGIAGATNVKIGVYTDASWDTGSLEHRPVQFYVGSSTDAPKYTVPDGSIITDYDSMEKDLMDSFDSKSGIDDINDGASNGLLSYATGLASVSKIFTTSLSKIPFISTILQISLALGVFAFIFSVAQRLRGR